MNIVGRVRSLERRLPCPDCATRTLRLAPCVWGEDDDGPDVTEEIRCARCGRVVVPRLHRITWDSVAEPGA